MGDPIGTPFEGCNHRERFKSRGGYDLCEMCARKRQGWKPCVECGDMLPPGERRCNRHLPKEEKLCPDCNGDGWVGCEEPDCHGLACHGEGWVDCPTCGGKGTVKRETEKATA